MLRSLSLVLRGVVSTVASVLLIVLSVNAEVKPRVIGGTNAAPGAYPWMVALVSSTIEDSTEAQFCGGTLIGPQFVLTAAHCMYQTAFSDTQVLIGGGALPFGRGDRVDTIGYVINPLFNPVTLEHDTALVKLAKPQPGPYLPTAGQADFGLITSNAPAQIVGYGIMSPFGTVLPVNLQVANVPVHNDAECLANLGRWYKPATMMCAGLLSSSDTAGDGIDTCQGDSGGPIIMSDSQGVKKVVGLTSWGLAGCASSHFYGTYAEVAADEPFVKSFPVIPPQALSSPYLSIDGYSALPYPVSVGSTLVCNPGQWVGDEIQSIAYEWYNNEGLIAGANQATYVTSNVDGGEGIYCLVTVSNAGGTELSLSDSAYMDYAVEVTPEPTVSFPTPQPTVVIKDVNAPSVREIGFSCKSGNCNLRVGVTDDQSSIESVTGVIQLIFSSHCVKNGQAKTCTKTRVRQVSGTNTGGEEWSLSFHPIKNRKQKVIATVFAQDSSANSSEFSPLIVKHGIKASR